MTLHFKMSKKVLILRRIMALFSTTLLAVCLAAQTLSSGYFLEGNSQRTMLNPALKCEQNYLSFPLLGNVSAGLKGNVGLSDFLYPYNQDGKALTTFMSKTVDGTAFLRRLPELSSVGADVDLSLLGVGFEAWGGYNTLRLSEHTDASVHIPKAFFMFAKQGFQHDSYAFSHLSMQALSYADLCVGHSRAVGEHLRVGANLHLLAGVAYADASVDRLELQMNESEWVVRSLANAEAGVLGDMAFEFDEQGFPIGVEGRFWPTSLGFGLDVGAECDLSDAVPGLRASAALTRLGRIGWKSALTATSGENTFVYNGFGEIDPATMDLDEEVQQIADEAKELMNLQFRQVSRSHTKLAPSLRLGAEYRMPFYSSLSAAVLYTHDFCKYQAFNEARLFLNISPTKAFEGSLNVAASTFGTAFGWMLNLHPKGFALMLGTDCMVLRITPQGIPVNRLNANLCVGINIPIS